MEALMRKYTFLEFIKEKKQLATIKRWRNLIRLETSVNYYHSIIPWFHSASSNWKVALRLFAESSWAQAFHLQCYFHLLRQSKKIFWPLCRLASFSNYILKRAGRSGSWDSAYGIQNMLYMMGARELILPRPPIWQMKKLKRQEMKGTHGHLAQGQNPGIY